MIFAKKTIGGYREIETSQSLPEETYVIMSFAENVALQQKLSAAEKQADSIQREYQHLQETYKKYFQRHNAELADKENTISRLSEEATIFQNQIDVLIAERDAALKDVQNAEYMNHNLKRILRQKSNQERGIKPVKSHSGYVLLRMDQATEHYKIQNDYQEWRQAHHYSDRSKYVAETPAEAAVWRNYIQTPHSSLLRADLAAIEILNDLTTSILKTWGCEYWQSPTENGTYRTWIDGDGKPVCGMYKWSLINDVRAGYWTVMIHTTLPLVIPVEPAAE